MIPVAYIRSSSLNTWESCQHQYYLEYVLGMKGDSNKAADKGTMVHKVMEILAICKKEFQDTGKKSISIIDDCIGKVSVSWDDFIKEEELDSLQIAKINKSRINKYNYGSEKSKFIQDGHVRLGVTFLEDIIERVYKYYEKLFIRDWQPVDFKDVTNWSWMTVDNYNRNYDPRLSDIVQPEQQFEFEIDANWAHYYYNLPEGELLGKVKLKGTIDLITRVGDNFFEIRDYKTGRRKNWTTGETKTLAKLQKDTQLLFYNYAIRKLYPDIENFMLTIYFIRGCYSDGKDVPGGPYTLSFEPEDLSDMEKKLEKTIYDMHTCKQPKLLDKYRKKQFCSFCHFNKTKDKNGESLCESFHDKIKKFGIKEVTKYNTTEGFSIAKYSAPGGE